MGMQQTVRRIIAMAAIAVSLSGCGFFEAFTEGLANCRAVDAALEQQVGLKPSTGFNLNNNYLVVTVQFPKPYASKPLAELGDIVRDVVTKQFKKKPNQILLSFALVQP